FFGPQYMDYATRVGDPMVTRLVSRHRLQKKDPTKAYDDPVQPIVYYVDAGAPEPIRTALVEGARWWNDAFEAAGFRNAFRVEVMPDSVDPMDVRYNVITWVHRATRGWSYGASYTDPRTGEILKGHVTLGSLRARQDYLLGEGLLSPYATGTEKPPVIDSLVLARIRQLSAHEVGHTLGMAHNYIASAQGNASVMDYPHPLVQLDAQGKVDLSKAYPSGIGAWDKVSVTIGYGQWAPGTDERRMRDSLVEAARRRGLTFLTDQDGRPVSSAHPQVHLWDNGPDAVAELKRVMTVRRAALAQFGTTAVPLSAPPLPARGGGQERRGRDLRAGAPRRGAAAGAGAGAGRSAARCARGGARRRLADGAHAPDEHPRDAPAAAVPLRADARALRPVAGAAVVREPADAARRVGAAAGGAGARAHGARAAGGDGGAGDGRRVDEGTPRDAGGGHPRLPGGREAGAQAAGAAHDAAGEPDRDG
nr:zinc-dependent metalloprotease [Gemmatimonadaceae bacterium]